MAMFHGKQLVHVDSPEFLDSPGSTGKNTIADIRMIPVGTIRELLSNVNPDE